jgi:hypothetical protein
MYAQLIAGYPVPWLMEWPIRAFHQPLEEWFPSFFLRAELCFAQTDPVDWFLTLLFSSARIVAGRLEVGLRRLL